MKTPGIVTFRAILCIALAGSLLVGCAQKHEIVKKSIIAKVQEKFVPDSRLGVFDIRITNGRLEGKTTSQAAKEELTKAFGESAHTVVVLPDQVSLCQNTFGFVRVPVATLYTEPSYTSSVLTQAVLGTPIQILQKNGWLQIKLPDGYIAWAVPEQIFSCDETTYKSVSSRLTWVVRATEAALREKPDCRSQRLCLLPAGARLFPRGEHQGPWQGVELADGTRGFVLSSHIQSITSLLEAWESLRKNPILYGTELNRLAMRLLGQSYLWGGTSTFAVDCSGFIQTVFQQTGILLGRDADMQASVGEQVHPPFLPGDLLFFGVKAERNRPESIRHVALSLGGDRFIHARGKVRLGSFSPKDPEFDAYETKRFLKGIRPNLTKLPRIAH